MKFVHKEIWINWCGILSVSRAYFKGWVPNIPFLNSPSPLSILSRHVSFFLHVPHPNLNFKKLLLQPTHYFVVHLLDDFLYDDAYQFNDHTTLYSFYLSKPLLNTVISPLIPASPAFHSKQFSTLCMGYFMCFHNTPKTPKVTQLFSTDPSCFPLMQQPYELKSIWFHA